MGLSYNEIVHSTLCKLSVYEEAHKIKKKMIDEQMYVMGCYNFEALTVALYNFGLGLSGKTSKQPKKYLDKPYLCEQKDIEEMTDTELDAEIRKAIQTEQQYMNRSKLPPTIIARRNGGRR